MPAKKVYVPHIKLQFGGNLGNPVLDMWTNSLRWRVEGADIPTPQQLQNMAAAAVPALQTWMTAEQTSISSSAKLNFAKVNWIRGDGTQRDVNTPQVEISNVQGGVTSFQAHWHDTFAVTLRSDLKRGRGHAGRIYPPLVMSFPAANSPYVPAVVADNLASSTASLLRSLAAAWTGVMAGHTFTPVIAAAGLAEESTIVDHGVVGGFANAPFLQPITRLVVDRVADVQHRRTNRVPRLEGQTVFLNTTGDQ